MSYSRLKGGSLKETAASIREFNKRLKKLKDYTKQIGSDKDTRKLRADLRQQREEAQQLSRDIMNSLNIHRNNKEEVSQYEKLSKEFTMLFEQYNKVNEETLEKEKQIAHLISSTLNDEEFKKTGVIQAKEDGETRQSLKLYELGCYDETELHERNQNIVQLEKDMVEVHKMFKDVAQMVGEQGLVLQDVEDHVDGADAETRKAIADLKKADYYQSRSRRTMYCVLLAVLVLIVVISVPLVVRNGN